MKSPIHILATVRKPELLAAALLVFRTLRVGFPTAPVYVWGNGLKPDHAEILRNVTLSIGGVFNNLKPTCHDAWIEQLVLNQARPFWIADTDLVFLEECEWFFEDDDAALFAGRLEPAWREPWSQTTTVERLHTCLQWFNPQALRGAMMRWNRQRVPEVFHTAQVPFIRQHFIPGRDGVTLYDTTAGLWQAGWGTPFTDKQNACFEHLHAATYADEVGKCETLKDLPAVHQAIYADPQLARGIQRQQNEFYASRQATPSKTKIKAKGKLCPTEQEKV